MIHFNYINNFIIDKNNIYEINYKTIISAYEFDHLGEIAKY